MSSRSDDVADRPLSTQPMGTLAVAIQAASFVIDSVTALNRNSISTSAEVSSFNRVPIGPRFATNRGALPTRLNDIIPNYFYRGAYRSEYAKETSNSSCRRSSDARPGTRP